MNEKKQWRIIGNTYQIKEDLKAHGCTWSGQEKFWTTPSMAKTDIQFQRLQSMSEAVGADMIPVHLSDQCKTIQDILRK